MDANTPPCVGTRSPKSSASTGTSPLAARICVAAAKHGSGLTALPPPGQVDPFHSHHRFDVFSCQIVPLTYASSDTFSEYPAAWPFSSTTPAAMVHTYPDASVMELLDPASITVSFADGVTPRYS